MRLCIMPLEPIGEPTRFWCGEGRVERGVGVGAEIVSNQDDFVGVGKMSVGQFAQHLRVVDGGVMVGHFYVSPSFHRREHHEWIGHAVPLIFVIVARGLSRLGRYRRARLDDQLLGGLIQTHQRTIGTAQLLVGFQHVFHGGHEAGVGVGRDHPLPIVVRFEDVFFKVRRECCHWPFRRCSIRRSSPRAGPGSDGRSPRAPASRSARSI